MSLIDMVEMLGESVDDGLISRSDAAQLLAEYSDGLYTLAGAARALDRHKGMRLRSWEDLEELRAILNAADEAEAATTVEEYLEKQAFLRRIIRENGIKHMRRAAWRMIEDQERSDTDNSGHR